MEIDRSNSKFFLTSAEQAALGLNQENANEDGLYEWDANLAPDLLELAEKARERLLDADVRLCEQSPCLSRSVDLFKRSELLRTVVQLEDELAPYLPLGVESPSQFED